MLAVDQMTEVLGVGDIEENLLVEEDVEDNEKKKREIRESIEKLEKMP